MIDTIVFTLEYATDGANFAEMTPTSRLAEDVLDLASLLSEEENSNAFLDAASLSPGHDNSASHSFLERTLSTDDPQHFFAQQSHPSPSQQNGNDNPATYVKQENFNDTPLGDVPSCTVEDITLCPSSYTTSDVIPESLFSLVSTTAPLCYPTLPQVKSLVTPIKSLPFSPSQVCSTVRIEIMMSVINLLNSYSF